MWFGYFHVYCTTPFVDIIDTPQFHRPVTFHPYFGHVLHPHRVSSKLSIVSHLYKGLSCHMHFSLMPNRPPVLQPLLNCTKRVSRRSRMPSYRSRRRSDENLYWKGRIGSAVVGSQRPCFSRITTDPTV